MGLTTEYLEPLVLALCNNHIIQTVDLSYNGIEDQFGPLLVKLITR